MREIKFRGKSQRDGLWWYGDLCTRLTPRGKMVTCPAIESLPGPRGTYFVYPETLGQYTGLKDKYGTEIYEGDILSSIGKNREYRREVIFKDGTFCIKDYYICSTTPLSSHLVGGKLKWEVIGNVHDNPELIKK